MPIRPETLLRDAKGRPQPESELLARIRRIDPRLSLFYTNAAWAIVEFWADGDPRRARIQNESMPPDMAFDICGYLPVTCSLDEAPAFIERELRQYDPVRYAKLHEAINDWNLADGGGVDRQLEETTRTAVEDDLHHEGPSLGIVAVAADLTPAAPPPKRKHRRVRPLPPTEG